MMRKTTITQAGSGFADVTEHHVPATSVDALTEHLDRFFSGEPTDAQRAAELRAQDESNALDSLQVLYKIAHGHSGQCRRVAAFLLSLYNGQRFPFDMTDFRAVDAEIFEHMLRVLRMDSRARAEVHTYFPNGGQAFERLANDWRLHSQAWRPTENGMCQQRDGYLCFIEPMVERGQLGWRWYVQSGGGWAWRGGEEVKRVAEGENTSASYGARYAEEAIQSWFDKGGETPYPDEE